MTQGWALGWVLAWGAFAWSAPLTTAGQADAAPNPQSKAGVNEWLFQGKEAFEQNRYPEALAQFIHVLEVDPEQLEAKKYILDISRALAKWEDDSRLKPGQLAQARAQALQAQRTYGAKMAQMNQELQLVDQALAGKNQKFLLAASVSLTRDVEEEFADSYFALQAKRYLEQLEKRLREGLKQGTFTEPKDSHLAKGFLYYHKGLLEPALEEWQSALSLDPADRTLQEQVGWLGDKVKKARDKAKMASIIKEAQKWFHMGLYEKSIESWAQVLAMEPKNELAITGLAKAQGKMKEDLLRGRLNRARELAKSGSSLAALQAWVAVLEVESANAEALSAVQKWRGNPTKARGPDAPTQKIPEGARRRTAEAEEQYAIGMAHYAQRDLRSALEAMERALQLDPKLRKAQVAVERIQAETGQ